MYQFVSLDFDRYTSRVVDKETVYNIIKSNAVYNPHHGRSHPGFSKVHEIIKLGGWQGRAAISKHEYNYLYTFLLLISKHLIFSPLLGYTHDSHAWQAGWSLQEDGMGWSA